MGDKMTTTARATIEDLYRVPDHGNHGKGDAQSRIYRRGEVADAEPAVPGWSMPVDELFE